jgi:hypothetical protein
MPTDTRLPKADEEVPVALHLELAPRGELRGSIRRRDDVSAVSFRGWIDFMVAVSQFRESATRANREIATEAEEATRRRP